MFLPYNIETNRWFNEIEIFCKGYMDDNAHIERLMVKEYWTFVEMVYDINEQNIMDGSTKHDIMENFITFLLKQKGWFMI